MSVAEWVDTYGIHHRRILWSSYRKLAWVGFEPTTTEFRSDALSDWAIRPWVQLALRANFLQLLQFHHFFSVTFHSGYCLRQKVFKIKNKHHSTFRLLYSSRSYRVTFENFIFTFYTNSFAISWCIYFITSEKYYTIHLTTQVKNIIDHFTKYLPSIIFIISIRTDLS